MLSRPFQVDPAAKLCPPAFPPGSTTDGDAADAAIGELLRLQHDNGCWEGEMVWCTMILSQYVIVRHVIGRSFDEIERARILRHYGVTRTAEGAWGLHRESPGYVFTTTLAYVALRLLGLGPEHWLVAGARKWLRARPGGVLAIPTWGKFWLALIGLYEYEGISPCPADLFLLPAWAPVHPRRLYCHTRYIYLAFAFLAGSRFRAPVGALVRELRRELYDVPYETIDFTAHRHRVAATDLFVQPAWLLRVASRLGAAYERSPFLALRRRALDSCFEQILCEQRASRYQGLSPVNGLLNCLAIWWRDRDHPDLPPSLDGVESWKWEDDEEGRRYAGARSQTWDTAFAMQAILAHPEAVRRAREPLRRGYAFLRQAQMTEEIPWYERAAREPVLGGWCFSDGQHRWPVSDCTAEAISAILVMHATPGLAPTAAERIPEHRLTQAVEFIMRRQNADGGFGTYERRRGSRFLEMLNPSEIYAQCMVEGSYVECTGSAVCALAHFRTAYPNVLRDRLHAAVARGVGFLRRSQRMDGSYAGAWGINFTYALFHAVKGLRAGGVSPDDSALVRATRWLCDKQRPDGGWGEHYTSCLHDQYVEHPQSQAVMTSWALLALLETLEPAHESIQRGIAWLRAQQRADGSWPEQAVNGVFFRTAMLDYRLYKSYFPAWALARFKAQENS